ncbi:hypothetical protein HOY82DRAFT_536711 [Tuber indicum]|nr:hypothetical protein HOY82DRAFT_536711 [Tuber indicum]
MQQENSKPPVRKRCSHYATVHERWKENAIEKRLGYSKEERTTILKVTIARSKERARMFYDDLVEWLTMSKSKLVYTYGTKLQGKGGLAWCWTELEGIEKVSMKERVLNNLDISVTELGPMVISLGTHSYIEDHGSHDIHRLLTDSKHDGANGKGMSESRFVGGGTTGFEPIGKVQYSLNS